MGKRSFAALLHTKPQWKDKTQCSYDCPAKQTPSSQQPGVIFNFPCHGKFALPFCRLGHSYLYIWAQKDVVRLGQRLPESTPAGCQCAAAKASLDGVPSWRLLSSLPPKQRLSSFGTTGNSSSAEERAAPSWIHTHQPCMLQPERSAQPARKHAKILTAEDSPRYILLITKIYSWIWKGQFPVWNVTQLLHHTTHHPFYHHPPLHHHHLHHLFFIHSSWFFQCAPSVKGQPHTVGHAGTPMCCDEEKNGSEQKLKKKIQNKNSSWGWMIVSNSSYEKRKLMTF